MSDSSFHHLRVDNESNRSLLSPAGAESKRGYYALEQTSYLQPAHETHHVPSPVFLEPGRSTLPPNNWPTDSPIHAHISGTTAQFGPYPFSPLQTTTAVPIPLYTSGSPPSRSDPSENFYTARPLTPRSDSRMVPTPSLTADGEYSDGLIDAHMHHYDPLFLFSRDNSIFENPRVVPSPFITMPIVPTPPGADASTHTNPDLSPAQILEQFPCHPTTTFQRPPLPDPTRSLSLPGSFDSEPYSSPGPSPSTDAHPLAVSPSEASDQIYSQPYMTASAGQPYTLTVPLEALEFRSVPGAGEAPFFQCRWADCGIWITSEKEAVKDHLGYVHNVALKSVDSVCCRWAGCSSSLQRNGLVRHFRAHLGLKWQCSVCKTAYTRQDSVWFHTRKESRCQLAHVISHPSAAAYKARINGDNTVTLTKILQPLYMT